MQIPGDIESQYKKGPGTMPEISQVDIPQQAPMDRATRLKQIKTDLPELRLFVENDRLQVEADELIMRQMTAWVMLGKVDARTLPESPLKNELLLRVNEAGVQSGKLSLTDEKGMVTVPGLQGLKLKVEELNTRGWLADFMNSHLSTEAVNKEKAETENNNG